MYIIDETYFTGEISIPYLPTSRDAGRTAYYGMALAVQTSGENDLYTFINEKTAEYLRSMFGDRLGTELATFWDNWQNDDTYTFTEVLTIDDTTPRITWTELEGYSNADILFTSFMYTDQTGEVTVLTPTSDKRFNNQRTVVFKNVLDAGDIKLRITYTYPTTKVEYYISASINQTVIVFDRRKTEEPEERYRRLYNVLLPYTGNRKKSPIANYVWYWLQRDASNHATSQGEGDLNFTRASNSYEADKHVKQNAIRNKLIRAWNDMASMNRDVLQYMRCTHPHRYHHWTFNPFIFPYPTLRQNHKNLTSEQNWLNI